MRVRNPQAVAEALRKAVAHHALSSSTTISMKGREFFPESGPTYKSVLLEVTHDCLSCLLQKVAGLAQTLCQTALSLFH